MTAAQAPLSAPAWHLVVQMPLVRGKTPETPPKRNAPQYEGHFFEYITTVCLSAQVFFISITYTEFIEGFTLHCIFPGEHVFFELGGGIRRKEPSMF